MTDPQTDCDTNPEQYAGEPVPDGWGSQPNTDGINITVDASEGSDGGFVDPGPLPGQPA